MISSLDGSQIAVSALSSNKLFLTRDNHLALVRTNSSIHSKGIIRLAERCGLEEDATKYYSESYRLLLSGDLQHTFTLYGIPTSLREASIIESLATTGFCNSFNEIGFAIVDEVNSVRDSDYSDNTKGCYASIAGFGILPQYRRMKHGTYMFDLLVFAMQQFDIRLKTMVPVSNNRACSFLDYCGFNFVKEHETFQGKFFEFRAQTCKFPL